MPGLREVKKLMLRDNEALEIANNGQRWLACWYPAGEAPEGRPHGSAGICIIKSGDTVLVSADGVKWDFPAGRREGDESWRETLEREMMEEACASVDQADLLGFCRSRCVEGGERGLVLVRSVWLARVSLLDWNPAFEITHRKIVPIGTAIEETPAIYQPVWQRAFSEAGLCSKA